MFEKTKKIASNAILKSTLKFYFLISLLYVILLSCYDYFLKFNFFKYY